MNEPKKFIYAVKRSTMLRAMLESMKKLKFLQKMWIEDTVLVELINDVLVYKYESNAVTNQQWNAFIGRELRYINLSDYLNCNSVGIFRFRSKSKDRKNSYFTAYYLCDPDSTPIQTDKDEIHEMAIRQMPSRFRTSNKLKIMEDVSAMILEEKMSMVKEQEGNTRD